MYLMHFLAITVLVAFIVNAAPNGWPRQMVMKYDTDSGDSKMLTTNSRAYLPPRYKNLFGGESVRPHRSAFIPKTMSEFTGKVGALRRQIFSWRPEGNVMMEI